MYTVLLISERGLQALGSPEQVAKYTSNAAPQATGTSTGESSSTCVNCQYSATVGQTQARPRSTVPTERIHLALFAELNALPESPVPPKVRKKDSQVPQGHCKAPAGEEVGSHGPLQLCGSRLGEREVDPHTLCMALVSAMSSPYIRPTALVGAPCPKLDGSERAYALHGSSEVKLGPQPLRAVLGSRLQRHRPKVRHVLWR